MSSIPGIREIESNHDGSNLRIGIAMSRFNPDIGEGLLSSCVDELKQLGVAADRILLITVPGALELPLALQTLAQGVNVDALVALGCVIRGETYHFEVVSNESARGIADVQLNTGIPIANAVLTTEDDDQALQRMAEKGRDAARCAVEMANLHKALR